MNEFTLLLYKEMKTCLSEINYNETPYLESSGISSGIILNYISKLKAFVLDSAFMNKEEEIDFFKHLKPKFYLKLIYHQKVISIQSHLPLAPLTEIKNYYLNELRKINDYMNKNHELVTYYRSMATSFDEIYFLRKEPDSWLLMNFEESDRMLRISMTFRNVILYR